MHTVTDFADRTVLVTGAGSGIGQALASRFLERGANVYGADIHTDGIPEGVNAIETDVAEPASVEAFIKKAVDKTGRLDVLCNNAGIGSTTSVVDCSVDEWDRLFGVNVRGVFVGIKAAVPHMLAAGRGSIVNTASVAGMIGLPDRAAYSATKGAVIALTKQVAVQYAGTGIRCNCVCPGTVASPWVERLLDAADKPDEAREALRERQPVGRLGTPEEVADLIVYLASDAADFVTGAAWVIDGGLTAK